MPWYAAQLVHGPVLEIEAESPAAAFSVLAHVKSALPGGVLRLDPMIECPDGERLVAPPAVITALAEGRVRLQ